MLSKQQKPPSWATQPGRDDMPVTLHTSSYTIPLPKTHMQPTKHMQPYANGHAATYTPLSMQFMQFQARMLPTTKVAGERDLQRPPWQLQVYLH